MTEAPERSLRIWLYSVTVSIAILILFGGFVRLSRSGLSIVEWHPIAGIVPPMDEAAWQKAFAKYRQTPEFRQINASMTVQAYKTIYLIEYTHRLLARAAGLAVIIPLIVFLFRGAIPLRQSMPYVGIGALFLAQGLYGWYMVQSGLMDTPYVSPYRLTAHLMLALTLMSLCLWLALRRPGVSFASGRSSGAWSASVRLSLGLLAVIVIQIAYGGLTAGLRAGDVSDTFPLMFGTLIPSGLFSGEPSWISNLFATAATVHFVHRWFSFVVLGGAVLVYYLLRTRHAPDVLQKYSIAVIVLSSLQILLGIGVILLHVPLSLALVHQGNAILLFAAAFLLHHRLREQRRIMRQ
jgi:cytochrome c oxidase assembly protein subunit 15